MHALTYIDRASVHRLPLALGPVAGSVGLPRREVLLNSNHFKSMLKAAIPFVSYL